MKKPQSTAHRHLAHCSHTSTVASKQECRLTSQPPTFTDLGTTIAPLSLSHLSLSLPWHCLVAIREMDDSSVKCAVDPKPFFFPNFSVPLAIFHGSLLLLLILPLAALLHSQGLPSRFRCCCYFYCYSQQEDSSSAFLPQIPFVLLFLFVFPPNLWRLLPSLPLPAASASASASASRVLRRHLSYLSC